MTRVGALRRMGYATCGEPTPAGLGKRVGAGYGHDLDLLRQTMSTIQIYTSGWCGFCIRAKRLLKKKGLEYEEIPIDQEPGRRAEMIQRSGRLTVPQVFIGKTHVGGSDDLARAEKSGELDHLLERAALDVA